MAKLLGSDLISHLSPGRDRHDNDEVEDVGELDGRDKEQKAPFGSRDGRLHARDGGHHFSTGGQVKDTDCVAVAYRQDAALIGPYPSRCCRAPKLTNRFREMTFRDGPLEHTIWKPLTFYRD